MAKLFTHSPSFLANAYVGQNGLLTDFSAHAEAWKSAADRVAGRALAGARGRLDYYFPVICYLYRHYVELELKVLIRLSARIAGRPRPADLSSTHSLAGLLRMLERLLASAGITNAGIDPGVRSMLLELHALDPDGQRFRYLTKKDDTVAIPDLAVDVRHLRSQMGKIWKNLIGVEVWLDSMVHPDV